MKSKSNLLLLLSITALIISCKNEKADMKNPFFTEYETPYQVPPFGNIRPEHYLPALDSAIILHDEEIGRIINNSEPPDFNNTIRALDLSGEMLNKARIPARKRV